MTIRVPMPDLETALETLNQNTDLGEVYVDNHGARPVLVFNPAGAEKAAAQTLVSRGLSVTIVKEYP